MYDSIEIIFLKCLEMTFAVVELKLYISRSYMNHVNLSKKKKLDLWKSAKKFK